MAEQKKDCTYRTSIGGQALIEGIMMRGPKKQSVVVRAPDGLKVKTEDLKLVKERYPILGWPIIRGSVNFLDSMIRGVKAMTYSAEFLPEDEQGEPSKLDKWIEKHFDEKKAEKLIIGIAVVLGILLAVGLFILLPTFLVGFLKSVIASGIVLNLIEGAVRITIFLLYLILVSRMKDIMRVWQYHGAEHKTIFCYERGLPLTVENARTQPREHPRCGTSFIIIVLVVSILVFSLVQWSNAFMRMALRILLLPVVVGISYEIIKYAGRHDNFLTMVISAPGKALQEITTAEPDDSMLEVAIEALKQVIPEEKDADKW
jgi:uncharacterized protein YqhQ